MKGDEAIMTCEGVVGGDWCGGQVTLERREGGRVHCRLV